MTTVHHDSRTAPGRCYCIIPYTPEFAGDPFCEKYVADKAARTLQKICESRGREAGDVIERFRGTFVDAQEAAGPLGFDDPWAALVLVDFPHYRNNDLLFAVYSADVVSGGDR